MWPYNNNNQQVYQEYAEAYESGNYSRFQPHQVLGHLQQFMQSAPADMQQQLYQQHFEQMPHEQRTLIVQQVPSEYSMDPNDSWSMSQGFLRMGREQPQLFHRIFSHPTMLDGTMTLTGRVARQMLDGHRRGQYGGRLHGDPQEELLQKEINQTRREERELRKELRQEERQLEEIEDEEIHRRRRRDY